MHKPWCDCARCKAMSDISTTADLSMFLADEIERLKKYRVRVANREFTDYPDDKEPATA